MCEWCVQRPESGLTWQKYRMFMNRRENEKRGDTGNNFQIPFLCLWNSHYLSLTCVTSLSRHLYSSYKTKSQLPFMCKLLVNWLKYPPVIWESPQWGLISMLTEQSAMFFFLTSTVQEAASIFLFKVTMGRVVPRGMKRWVCPEPTGIVPS